MTDIVSGASVLTMLVSGILWDVSRDLTKLFWYLSGHVYAHLKSIDIILRHAKSRSVPKPHAKAKATLSACIHIVFAKQAGVDAR